jgi:hypothetical protein
MPEEGGCSLDPKIQEHVLGTRASYNRTRMMMPTTAQLIVLAQGVKTLARIRQLTD